MGTIIRDQTIKLKEEQQRDRRALRKIQSKVRMDNCALVEVKRKSTIGV